MITPQSVYDLVLRCIGNNTCSVCDLHKPCIGHPCACVQHTPVIDFDEVERLWHISRKQPSTASADALVCHHNLCFVEIKGWIKFLENLHLTGERQLTDREEERLKGRILKQVGHYDFQKKLLSSIEVCEDITGTPDLLSALPVAFILVTDVNPETSPLEVFSMQLSMLAHTSTDWKKVCTEAMSQRLASQITSIHTYFVYCKDFGHLIKSL